jgi:hypothetical protein
MAVKHMIRMLIVVLQSILASDMKACADVGLYTLPSHEHQTSTKTLLSYSYSRAPVPHLALQLQRTP